MVAARLLQGVSMDARIANKIQQLEAERKKLTTYGASKDPKNAKRVDEINRQMSDLIRTDKERQAESTKPKSSPGTLPGGFDSWDSVLYKSMDGGYKVKAVAARNGITLDKATKAFGALPAKYAGQVSGYNPNLVKTDAALANKLGMTNSSGTGSATKNALATPSAPSQNGFTELTGKALRDADATGNYGDTTIRTPSLNPSPSDARGYSLTSTDNSNTYNKELKELETQRDLLTQYANEFGGEVMKKNLPEIERLNDNINVIRQGKDYNGSPASRQAELKELETQRDLLTQYANEFGGEVMKKNLPEIERLNDNINVIRQGKDYNGSPASRQAELKELEGYYGSAWNTPAGDGYLNRINELRGQLGMPTRQQEEATAKATAKAKGMVSSASDQARLSALEALYAATKGSPVAAAQLGEIQQLRQKMGMPAFTEQATNDNLWDQLWDTAGAKNTGVRGDFLDQVGYQAARVGSAVKPVLDPIINSDPTGTLAAVAATGGGFGTSAGFYPGVFSNPDRPNNVPTDAQLDQKIADETRVYNPSNPVGDFQRDQQVDNPAPLPVNLPQGTNTTLTNQGLEQVNVGNTDVGTTPNQAMVPTTGREIYPTPDGLPPTGQTVQSTPGTGGNPTSGGGTPAPGTVPPAPGTGGNPTSGGGDGGLGGLVVPGLIAGATALDAFNSNESAKRLAEATEEAAQIQADASNRALDLYGKQYDQQRHDLAPWRAAGEEALGYSQDNAGNWVTRPSGGLRTFDQDNPEFKVDPFKFDQDPMAQQAYNFRLGEGMKQLQASAAAKGMLRSGNTLQGITNYAQGAASQEYDNAFNRYQTNTTNNFNRFMSMRGDKRNALQSLAGVGQSAVQQTNNAAQNYGSAAGQYGMAGANARAQGMTGAAEANAAGTAGFGNALKGGLNSWLAYNQSNRMGDFMNAFARGR